MPAVERRSRSRRQSERRAKAARRPSRFLYPKTAARGLHQSRCGRKNQNPQNGHLQARFDWGFGAICFGASPVAAVFGSAPGSATPPEHRIHCKPFSQAAPSKQDISTLQRIGHFCFDLTRGRCRDNLPLQYGRKAIWTGVRDGLQNRSAALALLVCSIRTAFRHPPSPVPTC